MYMVNEWSCMTIIILRLLLHLPTLSESKDSVFEQYKNSYLFFFRVVLLSFKAWFYFNLSTRNTNHILILVGS